MPTLDYAAPPSPLKWHGGKHYLAKKIIALMPPHLHYVEPYAGSLAVLLERDSDRNWLDHGSGGPLPASLQGCSEVVNDLHGDLMNFWAVLRDTRMFSVFQRVVVAVPFSEYTWGMAVTLSSSDDRVERAVGFFVRCRQSRAGTFKGFATLSRNRTRRGMNEQASAWLATLDGLPEVHARLKRVVILNHDALQVIRQRDGDKTRFYLDPPYLAKTRTSTGQYDYEMTHRICQKTSASASIVGIVSATRASSSTCSTTPPRLHTSRMHMVNASAKHSRAAATQRCVATICVCAFRLGKLNDRRSLAVIASERLDVFSQL